MYHARQHAIPTKSSLRLFQGPCRGEPWLARFCNYKSARGRPSSAPIKQCVKSPSVAKLPDQIPIPPNALPFPLYGGRGRGMGVKKPSGLCGKHKTQQYRALQPSHPLKNWRNMGLSQGFDGGIPGAPRDDAGTNGRLFQPTWIPCVAKAHIRSNKGLDRSERLMICSQSRLRMKLSGTWLWPFTSCARPANPKGTNLFRGSRQVYNAAERRSAIPKS